VRDEGSDIRIGCNAYQERGRAMLTPKQNFLEVKNGGHPDRFVKQYEYFVPMFTPIGKMIGMPMPGELNYVNGWGVTSSWAPGQPGAFPVHTPDKIVCKDIEHWQDYVHAPDPKKVSETAWEEYQARFESIDPNEQYAAPFLSPGIFEQTHYLMEIKNCLIAFYENPDEMHELIKYLVDWELQVAELVCDHIPCKAMFHHDDWGSQTSTFLSPDMWAEFFLDPYKELYGYWKERGVEIIIHHSDSYAATLVPYMIEVGIDVWQGVMNSNNIPELIEKYGGQITFMGGVDSATIDYEGWTQEVVDQRVKEACDACGPLYFIPCASQGLPLSNFPGVYAATDDAIDRYSKIYWEEHGL